MLLDIYDKYYNAGHNDSDHEYVKKFLIRVFVIFQQVIKKLFGFLIMRPALEKIGEGSKPANKLCFDAHSFSGRYFLHIVAFGWQMLPYTGMNGSKFFIEVAFALCYNNIMTEQKNIDASRFEQALADGQFEVYYQPVIHAVDQSCIGAEALLRWHHPEKGVLLPGSFMHYAVKCGMISKIDAWALQRVISDFRSWYLTIGLRLLPVSVNIAGSGINETDVTSLIAILNKSALAREFLTLEFTHNTLSDLSEQTKEQLMRLKRTGIRLAMDDFGSKGSAEGYLERFRIDTIKIDYQLTRRIVDTPDARSLSTDIVKTAHGFGQRVIAAGVETQEQAEILKGIGCDGLQGFLFDAALQADAFTEAYLKIHSGVSR
jgi:EAL domain-containing protein (putative c-di-GMP-specific phosphodiesterase class I)